MRMRLVIRFDYGSIRPWITFTEQGMRAIAGPDTLCLSTPVRLAGDHQAVVAEFEVARGEKIPFVLTHMPTHNRNAAQAEAQQALRDTEMFWRSWIDRCTYRGPWDAAVRRAVITLKALIYRPTGGVVAAATSALPEVFGGKRNWDYRYCWLRDATYTLQALLDTGYVDEAKAWRDWLVRAVAGDPSKLQIDEWRALRHRIHADVCEHGFDADRGTFTQFYGSRGLDAALLLIPRVRFLPWDDPRVVGTVEAVQRELSDNGLIVRYRPGADGDVDGIHGGECAFLACTFWLADALHGIGRRDEARALFERLLDLRNDVGLLSEQYDTDTARQLGNFPQAFSMVGLINTARHLQRDQ